MKRIAGIFILMYYSLGSLVLPLADFSMIPDLPACYAHCKLTEHRDMQLTDFITDHLLSLDGIFDEHDNGDEQKPHRPLNYKIHRGITMLMFVPHYSFAVEQMKYIASQTPVISSIYKFNYSNTIFRPPIA